MTFSVFVHRRLERIFQNNQNESLGFVIRRNSQKNFQRKRSDLLFESTNRRPRFLFDSSTETETRVSFHFRIAGLHCLEKSSSELRQPSSESSSVLPSLSSFSQIDEEVCSSVTLFSDLFSLTCSFRGLYLVSLMLSNDRILLTHEDVLPMIEVDENCFHNFLADFQWFFKLTFIWDDLKNLKADFERCSSSTSFYLRIKLIQAALELQVGLFPMSKRVSKQLNVLFSLRTKRTSKKRTILVVYIFVRFATMTETLLLS